MYNLCSVKYKWDSVEKQEMVQWLSWLLTIIKDDDNNNIVSDNI